jgi:lysozyme
MMNNLKPSQACLNIVKHFEGLHKLAPDGMVEAYLCPAGKWTIGYGRTKGVAPAMRITRQQAETDLIEDLIEHANYVNQYVRVPLTQSQFDALTSFVFNLGPGNFKSSTLLKKLNIGDYDGAALEFGKWNKARVDGVLQPLPGLTRRRTAEASLFAMDAPVGSDGFTQPQKPEQEAVKSLTKSKTMAGATIAGAGTVATELADHLQPIMHVSDTLKMLFVGLTIVGIGIVIFSRWKDHKDGVH